MPIPNLITDLSTTPATNVSFINGAADAVAVADDHMRTVYAFLKQIYDVSGTQALLKAQLDSQYVGKTGDQTMNGQLTMNAKALVIGSGDFNAASSAPLEVRSDGTGTGRAVIDYHRPGIYGVKAGLDVDDDWKIGGWVDGANVFRFMAKKGGSAEASGVGQTTTSFNTAGSIGGSFIATDTGSAVGNGGAFIFSGAGRRFAAIKGSVLNGGGNGVGSVRFLARLSTVDATLTDVGGYNNSGAWNFPRQPGFSAFVGTPTTVGTAAPIVFNQVTFNRGANYNPATGRYTVPVAGDYFVSFSIEGLAASGQSIDVSIYINDFLTYTSRASNTTSSNEQYTKSDALIIPLLVNDVVDIRINYVDGFGLALFLNRRNRFTMRLEG